MVSYSVPMAESGDRNGSGQDATTGGTLEPPTSVQQWRRWLLTAAVLAVTVAVGEFIDPDDNSQFTLYMVLTFGVALIASTVEVICYLYVDLHRDRPLRICVVTLVLVTFALWFGLFPAAFRGDFGDEYSAWGTLGLMALLAVCVPLLAVIIVLLCVMPLWAIARDTVRSFREGRSVRGLAMVFLGAAVVLFISTAFGVGFSLAAPDRPITNEGRGFVLMLELIGVNTDARVIDEDALLKTRLMLVGGIASLIIFSGLIRAGRKPSGDN